MALITLLWRGKIPLVITYWVFMVLEGLLFKMVSAVPSEDVSPSQLIVWIAVGLLSFQLAYSVFITVAVWRAADAYEGKSIYANLAKIVAGLGLFLGLPLFILAIIDFVTVLAS